MKEEYKPSEEEINKAEDNLTESEEFKSDKRRGDHRFLKEEMPDLLENLKNGEYNLKLDGYRKKMLSSEVKSSWGSQWNPDGKSCRLYGRIGSNEIDIKVKTAKWPYDGSVNGQIDGEIVSDEIAKELFDKYIWVVGLTDNSIFEEYDNDRKKSQAEHLEKQTSEYKLKEKEEKEEEEKEEELNNARVAKEEKLAQEKVDNEKEKFKDIL